MKSTKIIIAFVLMLATVTSTAGCLSPINNVGGNSGSTSGTDLDPGTTAEATDSDFVTGPAASGETDPPVTTEEIEEQPIIAGDWMWREGYGMYDEGYHIPFGIYENVYFDKFNIIGLIYGPEMPQQAQQQAWEQMKNSAEVRNLPYVYLAVKNLGTEKSKFVECNENIKKLNEKSLADGEGIYDFSYTDDEIEYLFGDYGIDETIEHLKAPWAYYYRGRLYTIFNIFQIENEKLIAEMYSRGGLEEYIQNMKRLLNGDVANYLEGAYEVGDEERVILNMISDFETLPLKEFQSKHSLEYGIGFDWENYVPEELRP